MAFKTIVGLARASGIRVSQLFAILHNIEGNYRLYRIPKRGGEFRSISMPKPALRALQRTIVDQVLVAQEVPPCVHAYARGRSAYGHALSHLGAADFIMLDVKEFFPSISTRAVEEIFYGLGFGSKVAGDLAKLCTLGGVLPQGAPTSPMLSNLAMREVDAAFSEFGQTHKLKYSRYADDIVLSGRRIDVSHFELAKSLLDSCGFQINLVKSRLMRRPSKVVLTGISISTGEPKVPKAYKRRVRREAHAMLVGDRDVFWKDGAFDPFALDRVIGRLTYWRRVEPSAQFPDVYIQRLRERFGAILGKGR